MTATLTCVVEDRPAPPLLHEHGLAVWVAMPDGAVLFDTGGSGAVLRHNLTALAFDPAAVDAVVLSHAHDDHTGGLPALLPQLPAETPLYAHPTLFRRRFSDHGEGPEARGVPVTREALAERLDLRLSASPQEVLPGVWTPGEITERPHPEGRSARHAIQKDGEFVPDPYSDDLSLVVETDAGLFLLCGCCHAGLLNTLTHVQKRWDAPIVGVGGGTHLHGADPETLEATLDALAALPQLAQVWLGHCSGAAFMAAAQERFGDRYRVCRPGMKVTVG